MSIIDEYLQGVQQPQRDALARVRKIIQQVLPEAEEAITYGMPGYRYKNKYLISFAAFKDHMSVFPGAAPIATLQDQLGKFKISTGTVQFTIDNPIPESTLAELVRLRAAAISKR